MKKVEKMFLTPKWQEIKAMYEVGTNGSNEYETNFPLDGELDELTQHFVGYIIMLTESKGFKGIVEDISLDLWKERIWNLIENAGLLPNIAWKDDKAMDEARDSWMETDEEYYVDLDKLEAEIYGK